MPPRLRMLALLLALSALLSSGCATPPAPALVVPPTLARCAPAPPVPHPDDGDAALAGFILALSEAGEDCRTRLRLVWEIVGQ